MKIDDNKLSAIPKIHKAKKKIQSWVTWTPRKVQVGSDASEE